MEIEFERMRVILRTVLIPFLHRFVEGDEWLLSEVHMEIEFERMLVILRTVLIPFLHRFSPERDASPTLHSAWLYQSETKSNQTNRIVELILYFLRLKSGFNHTLPPRSSHSLTTRR
jgi:hypothetical protein